MKIAILSKDIEYAKMLEYELCDRGCFAFAYDGNTNADTVICDIDSISIKDKVFEGIKVITFSRKKDATLTRPFAISDLCELIGSKDNGAKAGNIYPVLDYRKRKLSFSQREISLSPLEAAMYNELLSAKTQTVTNEKLLSLFKSQGENGSDRIRVLVNSLKKKIKQSFDLDIIENVRGEGYRLKTHK